MRLRHDIRQVTNPYSLLTPYVTSLGCKKLGRLFHIMQIVATCSSSISTKNIMQRLSATGDDCGIRCVQRAIEELLHAGAPIGRRGAKGDIVSELDDSHRMLLITDELAAALMMAIQSADEISPSLKNEWSELQAILKSYDMLERDDMNTRMDGYAMKTAA